MILNVYAIYDIKSKFYSRPYYCINDGVAVRSFSQLANDPASELCRHPTDFTLFRLGTYNDELGSFHNEEPPENLGLAASFKTSTMEVNNAPQS